MDPTPTQAIGCRIVAEFDDDAGKTAQPGPEFVPVPTTPGRPVPVLSGAAPPPLLLPPSEETLAVAKKLWLKVLRRFTEPVPGKKGRLRVRELKESDRGTIAVEFGWSVSNHGAGAEGCRKHVEGAEVDVGDKQCLTVFGKSGPIPNAGKDGLVVREWSIPILWTEITSISFQVDRREDAQRQG